MALLTKFILLAREAVQQIGVLFAPGPKLLDVQAALDVLPAWPLNGSDEPDAQKATGTDGRKFAPGFAATAHNLVQTVSIRDNCGDLAGFSQAVIKARKSNDLRAFQEQGRRGSNPQPLDRQSQTYGLQVSMPQDDTTDNSNACTTACTSEAETRDAGRLQALAEAIRGLTAAERETLRELLTDLP